MHMVPSYKPFSGTNCARSLTLARRSVNDFFYIGGQLNTENLPGNQFVNFAAIGLTELPSAFIGKVSVRTYKT